MCRSGKVELLVYHVPERSVVDYAADKVSVHKKARGSRQSKTLCFFKILLHCVRFPSAIQAGIKSFAVELQDTSMLLQRVDIDLFAIEQNVVVLPEFSLLSGAACSLCRLLRPVVHGQREVLVHDGELVTIIVLELLYLGVHLLAIRAFIICEFHENDRSIL